MSQLFTDLSAAEQEVVAGGVDFIDFGELSKSFFNTNALAAQTTTGSVAGPGGAATTSVKTLQTASLLADALNQAGIKIPGK